MILNKIKNTYLFKYYHSEYISYKFVVAAFAKDDRKHEIAIKSEIPIYKRKNCWSNVFE